MVTPARIIRHIKTCTAPLVLLGRDEVKFQDVRDNTAREDEKFSAVMALWIAQLRFYAEFDVISGRGERPLAQEISLQIDRARMRSSLSVEHHLFTRGRQTASWSDGNNKAVKEIVDKDSIVDGKKLAICVTTKAPYNHLALVPRIAEEGDLVVQMGGSRVPFVVGAPADSQPNVKLSLARGVNRRKFASCLRVRWGWWAVKRLRCRLVGECVLNGFEELPGDSMPTRLTVV